MNPDGVRGTSVARSDSVTGDDDRKSQAAPVRDADPEPSSLLGPSSRHDPSTVELLARLASVAPDAAWRDFLNRYSPLIMQVVRRYEADSGRITDCFQHVCNALSDDGFRRLRSYRPDGPARFRTWLMAVTANLCRDWQRRQRGRYRPVRAVARLPELDQLVYRFMFVRRMPRAECLRALEPRFPGLTDRHLAEINGRLFNLLTPQQRWQLGARAASMGSQVNPATLSLDEAAPELEDPGAGPEQWAESEQERAHLQAALAELPADQRLLLRLRYEQGLTLAEVARLTRLQDPFRAHRKVQAALSALAIRLNGRPDRPGRKKP